MAERVGGHLDLGALERKDVWTLATIRKRSNGLKSKVEWHRDRKDDVQHAGLRGFFQYQHASQRTNKPL